MYGYREADPATVGPLYKVTGPRGECLNGGSGVWPLPVGDRPGEWWDIAGDLEPCRNGLHLTDAANLAAWLPRGGLAYRVWRVETRGAILDTGKKYAAQSVRLLPPNTAAERRYAAAGKRYASALARAETAYQRAMRAASRIPEASGAAAAYVRALGGTPIPKGSPIAAALTPSLARDMAERQAAEDRMAAERAAFAAYQKAQAAYLAAL